MNVSAIVVIVHTCYTAYIDVGRYCNHVFVPYLRNTLKAPAGIEGPAVNGVPSVLRDIPDKQL